MKEEKKGFKNWFKEKKEKVLDYCEKHPDVVLTLVGGLMSIAGGALKIYANKSEYEDYLYTISDEDHVYKVPAKKMKTASRTINPSEKID